MYPFDSVYKSQGFVDTPDNSIGSCAEDYERIEMNVGVSGKGFKEHKEIGRGSMIVMLGHWMLLRYTIRATKMVSQQFSPLHISVKDEDLQRELPVATVIQEISE